MSLLLAAADLPGAVAWAKDGGSGSSNSGSGSDNSGSGSGSGDGGDDNSGSGSHNSGKYKDQYGAQEAVISGEAITLEDALKKLRLRFPGKVISVNLGNAGSQLVYWFKVTTFHL